MNHPAPQDTDSQVRFGIESPEPGRQPAREIVIVGWCFTMDGEALMGVRARIKKRIFKANRKQTRTTVARMFPEHPSALKSGFSIPLTLPRGTSQVTIEYRPVDGEWTTMTTLDLQSPPIAWPWKKPAEPVTKTYADWVARYDTWSVDDYAALRDEAGTWTTPPDFSIILPVYNTDETHLREAIESVLGQTYPHWQLCIADDCSTQPHVARVLEEFAAKDSRIAVAYREKNGHICEASNSALELATGTFAVLLDHDDVLPLHALHRVARELAEHPESDLIFSDEDKIDELGQRCDPTFKPDFNQDLLLSQNCISHLGVYRLALVREVGGFRPEMVGSQDWDLALRVIDRSTLECIRHIPEVLYHWRVTGESTSTGHDKKPYTVVSADRAVADCLSRREEKFESIEVVCGNYLRVRYPLPEPAPLVTAIIPTRNYLSVLRPCVMSLLQTTDYPNLEILIVDNDSDDPETLAYLDSLCGNTEGKNVRVLKVPGAFNYSRLNNLAATEAKGSVLVLMNNDIEARDSGWLREMVSHAVRPGVGAVGAKLLYPDGNIQHAGVFLGYHDAAGHLFKGLPGDYAGHAHRAHLLQNFSAVTAACMAVEKEKYLAVDGLNADAFAVAYNDVDFCLRLIKAGYRNVFTPYAMLCHYESASRGEAEQSAEQKARANREREALHAAWGEILAHDPAYNPNLSLGDEHGSLAFPPAGHTESTPPRVQSFLGLGITT